MYNKLNFKFAPVQVIEHYLNNGSLRKTAKEFNIHYQTVYKWVKIYKEIKDGKGEVNDKKIEIKRERISTGYRRPWNRKSKDIEEKIILLKEKNPFISVRKAKELLEKENIKISIKGIWSIWKRYGYCGFKKENMSNNFTQYIPWSKEAIYKYNIAKIHFDTNEIKMCAQIINSIPSLPKNEIIENIPDKFLNIRRKLEKNAHLFGKIPLKEYLKKVKKTYKSLKDKKFYYSTLRSGIQFIIALEWQGRYYEALREIKEIEDLLNLNKIRKSSIFFEPLFTLNILKGIALCNILKTEEARKIANTCRKIILKKKNQYYLMYSLAFLYINLNEYKKAESLLLGALNKLDERTNNKLKGALFNISLLKGKYKFSNIKEVEWPNWSKDLENIYIYGTHLLIKGFPLKAISILSSFISNFGKKEIIPYLFNIYLTLASAYMSINKREKAYIILKSLKTVLKKYSTERGLFIINNLLNNEEKKYSYKCLPPSIRLLILLKNKKYYEAFNYAKKKYLLTSFFKYIFFFPHIIMSIKKRRTKVKIPKAISKLPIFNGEPIIFYIEFLNNFKIYKNNKHLKIKLSPKEKAFLIHIALRINEPETELNLEDIYNNFWPQSKIPKRNLSCLLSNIRKKVNIPNYLIEIRRKENILINNGIYFTTDYSDFEFHLTQANLFLKIGKLNYAEKEILKSINILKEEPFKKMYDRWSCEMRMKILGRLDNEFKKIKKELIEKGEFKRILKIHLKIKKLFKEFK